MRELVENFSRQNIFDYYNVRENPFIILVTKIDITNIYNKCQNHYAALGYFIALAVNKVDNFKYRCEDGKIYKYDIIHPSYTDIFKDNELGFYTCELKDNYNIFREEYLKIKKQFLDSHQNIKGPYQDEIWLSCLPWMNFSAIIPPFDKTITIPQFIWDKFIFENGKCYTNLMIMVHHGFVDGFHINQFMKELEDIINDIDSYI